MILLVIKTPMHQENSRGWNDNVGSSGTFVSKSYLNIQVFRVWGHAVTHLVKALCYKPKGHGFDSR